jgi:hypothetical protein
MPIAPATPRRRLARPVAAALLALGALGAAACSDSTGPRPPLEGAWLSVGLPAAAPTGATIELTLRQEGADVSGTGSMTYPPGFASEITVEGTVSGTVVMLTLASPALAQPMTMQAILADGGGRFTGPLTLGASSQQRTFERDR